MEGRVRIADMFSTRALASIDNRNRALGNKLTLSNAAVRAELTSSSLKPPFGLTTYAQWIGYKRAQLAGINASNAVEKANQYVNQQSSILQQRLDQLWQQTRFPQAVQTALAAGVGLAAAGLAIGVAIGGVAGPIGAAVGFVVGMVLGFLPWGDWDLFKTMRQFYDALTVEERYLFFRTFREQSNYARTKREAPPYPAWQLIDGRGRPRGGLENTVYIIYQALWERNSVPEYREIVPYALALGCVQLEPNDRLRDEWEYDRIVNRREGSPWLREVFLANKDRTAADIRAAAARAGAPDIENMIVPYELADSLIAINNSRGR